MDRYLKITKNAGASGLDSIIYIIYKGPLIDTNKGVTGEGENDERSSPDKAIVTHACTQQCILLIIVSKPFPLYFWQYFRPRITWRMLWKSGGGTEILRHGARSLIVGNRFGRSLTKIPIEIFDAQPLLTPSYY